MKLLTINTHSLIEEDYDEKCRIFASAVAKIKPDIIAMQEVNQSINSPDASSPEAFGYIRCDDSSEVKEDNHALKISDMLKKCGEHYFFTWSKIKCGYEKFDEGIAIFSRTPFDSAKSFYLTKSEDYNNFKTRKALSVKIQNKIFCSAHLGWFEDTDEPYSHQLNSINAHLDPKSDDEIYLMGDFNAPSHREDGGYYEILKSGWIDTYNIATDKDRGYTVDGKIDGWNMEHERKRIDYIFTNHNIKVLSSKVIFNGENEEKVSDHNGILVVTE